MLLVMWRQLLLEVSNVLRLIIRHLFLKAQITMHRLLNQMGGRIMGMTGRMVK
jgi:hypothetical protein